MHWKIWNYDSRTWLGRIASAGAWLGLKLKEKIKGGTFWTVFGSELSMLDQV